MKDYDFPAPAGDLSSGQPVSDTGSLHNEMWKPPVRTDHQEDLAKLYTKFVRQGNVMTESDWDSFGKIMIDLSGGNIARDHLSGHDQKAGSQRHYAPSPKPQIVAQSREATAIPSPSPADRQPEPTVKKPDVNTASRDKQADGGDNQAARPAAVSDSTNEIHFPPRTGEGMGGSEFFRDVLHADSTNAKVKGLTGAEREKAILAQVEAGNIPDFLRHAKEVTVKDKAGNEATLKVMPDYLAIGTNDDYVRVPVTPVLAKTLAEKYGLALPTKKVVDDIYRNADVKLTGRGLVHTKEDCNYMDGNGFYLKHNQQINDSLRGQPQDALVAGQKKDIIVSRYLENHSDRLDFYGLYGSDGKAIQGAHGGPHENTYVDYSHGARFISQDVVVNGKHMTYDEVLQNKELAGLLSDEGTVQTADLYKKPVKNDYVAIADAGSSRSRTV